MEEGQRKEAGVEVKAKYPYGTWVTGTMTSEQDQQEYDGIHARIIRSEVIWSTRSGDLVYYKLKDSAGNAWTAYERDLDRSSDGPRGWEPKEST